MEISTWSLRRWKESVNLKSRTKETDKRQMRWLYSTRVTKSNICRFIKFEFQLELEQLFFVWFLFSVAVIVLTNMVINCLFYPHKVKFQSKFWIFDVFSYTWVLQYWRYVAIASRHCGCYTPETLVKLSLKRMKLRVET